MNKYEIVTMLLIIMFFMSLITFIIYGIDKRKAKLNKWRIPEKVLLTLPWLLGSLGGVFGLYILRHKTKHWYFILNNIFSLIIQFIIFAFIIIRG